jgi:Mitochondrial ATPase expression/Pentatricopeptide repeat domain
MPLRLCSRCASQFKSSLLPSSLPPTQRRALKTLVESSDPVSRPLVKTSPLNLDHARRPKRPPQSLEFPPETPFTKITLSTSFANTAHPSLLGLLNAVARKDDTQWWQLYTSLSQEGNLKRLTHSQYSQILRALHPNTFFSNTDFYRKQHFIDRINGIKDDMVARGMQLTQADWGHILDCGRALQRPDQTRRWWGELMQSGVAPDVWAYNSYLASICGTAPKLQNERPIAYKLGEEGEVITLGKTTSRSINPIQRYPLRNMSVVAMRVIHEMNARSISPNAHSYELLITAHARDNNVDAINQVVEKVWGVTTDGELSANPGLATEGIGSPLLPTQHTLNVIANAYGYNGALAAAVSLIHKISEEYKLVIPVSAWLSLLLWTCRRSAVHKRPKLGFLSPLVAPQLFKTMTSEPYLISPGVEAYYLMINHEVHRNAIGSAERLLVDVIKRYGPNGTDLSEEQRYQGSRTLAAVKNWVPILCDRASRRRKEQALGIWQRWQERFHLIETTGLMREWDEVDESRKGSVPGVILPATTEQTSYSIRKRIARNTARTRKAVYRNIQKQREEHYLPQWDRSGQALPISKASNIQFGLGSPSKYFRKSHRLWRRQIQGAFGRERTRREKDQLDWERSRGS